MRISDWSSDVCSSDLRSTFGQASEAPGRRVIRPMRRPQALDPAALLIDEDRRIGPPANLLEVPEQTAHLVRCLAVASEQNEPARVDRKKLVWGKNVSVVGVRGCRLPL